MAFPNDLGDVVVFKIHPAIGIARVSMNDDYFVFGRDPCEYKSGGLLKRQAVQFRVFAYGEGHVGLGELTPRVMEELGVSAVWSARVANRKIARLRQTPVGGEEFVISASASSDEGEGRLVGSLPTFEEGAEIPLGQITPTGLFIPPKGGVYRQTAGEEVPGFPALSDSVADTTCDGSVSVRLTKDGQELPALPACVVVAPPDFSPDTDPVERYNGTPNTLLMYLRSRLVPEGADTPRGNLHNQTAREIDEAALRPGTQDFDPGFEVCFEDFRSEVQDVTAVFYSPEQDPAAVAPGEFRVRYKTSAGDAGAVPGQLTSGLCSPWQGDFTACVGYWTEHLPEETYAAEDSSAIVRVFRKEYANQEPDAPTLSSAQDFVEHVDKVGVVRLRDGKRVETERGEGDDIP